MAHRFSSLYLLFADLLEYPAPMIHQTINQCVEELGVFNLLVKDLQEGFLDYLDVKTRGPLDEIYTHTFDLNGPCPLYIGHQLFGESYKRSWFMARLSEEYKKRAFIYGSELPDHVSVILRFLAQCDEDEFCQVLLTEGLIPAVEKMNGVFGENSANPYKQILNTLLLMLQESSLMYRDKQVVLREGGSGNA